MLNALILAAALTTLDAPIEQAMRDANATKFAIAVVQDDKVIYQRTFGATNETPFYLASVPKSLTALTARLLAHEKKLDLDAPLTTTLPQLKLPPPLDPARMSVRDLLTHRLGFTNDGAIWRTSFSGDWTGEQLFKILERHTVVTPRVFTYDNLGYNLAAFAVEHAAKEPWANVLSSRVLAPLSMTHTTSTPCISTKSARTMNRGSGGLCSSIDDMTRWLRVNMTDGVFDGKRVFPLAVMREIHSPQISLQRKFGRLDRYAYGLGWYHADYQGDVVIHHFGSYPGAWAHVSWMPDRRIGIVTLANAYNPLPDVVAMLAYDTLLGRDTARTQFDEDMKKIRERLASRPQRNAELEKKIASEVGDSDRTLGSYAGTYVDEALGTMIVREQNGELHATMGDRSGRLIRARGDAFYVQWYSDDGPDRVTFTADALKWMDRELKRNAGVPPAE
ncbi:MAG TPA: serine hydrolase domain-containing protein [Thermoanaerobaculia bacterium]|nr:serine hydrolase domain-containing protein [Thermoanaerobaculia bacterium]